MLEKSEHIFLYFCIKSDLFHPKLRRPSECWRLRCDVSKINGCIPSITGLWRSPHCTRYARVNPLLHHTLRQALILHISENRASPDDDDSRCGVMLVSEIGTESHRTDRAATCGRGCVCVCVMFCVTERTFELAVYTVKCVFLYTLSDCAWVW